MGTGEQWKEEMDGFACTVFSREVVWMIKNPEDGMCELYGVEVNVDGRR